MAGEPGARLWSAGMGAAPPLTRGSHVPARHEHSSHDPDQVFVVKTKIWVWIQANEIFKFNFF